MRSAISLLFIALVCTPVPMARAQPAAGSVARADAPSIPDTPEGRCAAAYFRAFNTGDERAVAEFETAFRSAEALAKVPLEERLKRYPDLRREWGNLTVKRGGIAGDASLTFLVSCEATGEDQFFEFQFEKGGAGRLTAIEIRGPIAEAEAAALLEPVDAPARSEVVGALVAALDEMYVFPETAARLGSMLKTNLEEGKYDSISSAIDLARVLTEDMQALCHDKHLRVRPGSPGDGPFRAAGPGGGEREDYGFRRVERLPGNIGYVKFDRFHPAPEALKVAGAALAFLSDCDALIFDVRENGGGSPVMIQFLCSYLFETPTHLNSFYDRVSGDTRETWTDAEIPGTRFPPDLPVYVLTSKRTFSAAEEFTYDLQCLKRATIVGETTGGGAHPVRPRPLGGRFFVTVPFARAINPITETNWEGVGVKPEIEVPADRALDAAVEDARAKIRGRG